MKPFSARLQKALQNWISPLRVIATTCKNYNTMLLAFVIILATIIIAQIGGGCDTVNVFLAFDNIFVHDSEKVHDRAQFARQHNGFTLTVTQQKIWCYSHGEKVNDNACGRVSLYLTDSATCG